MKSMQYQAMTEQRYSNEVKIMIMIILQYRPKMKKLKKVKRDQANLEI